MSVRPLLALLLTCAFAVSGCTSTPQSTPDSTATSAPSAVEDLTWEPKAGDCHNGLDFTMTRKQYELTDCSANYLHQTVHVANVNEARKVADSILFGEEKEIADMVLDPKFNLQARHPWKESHAYEAIFGNCEDELNELIGGEWKERRLRLRAAFPSAAAWENGARWVSCEVSVIAGSEWAVQSAGIRLGDSLTEAPELQFGCLEVAASSSATTPKACTEPHNAEYVGNTPGDLTNDYTKMLAEYNSPNSTLLNRCWFQVSKFAGAKQELPTYLVMWYPKRDDWNAGDHQIRCFLYLGDKTSVSKSLKGVGAAGWPLKG